MGPSAETRSSEGDPWGVYGKGALWRSLIHTVIHTLSEGRGREVGGIFLFGGYDLQNQRELCHLTSEAPRKVHDLQSSKGASEASNWSGKGLREGSLGTIAVIQGRNLKRLWWWGAHQSRADRVIKGESLDGLTQRRLSSPRIIISSNRG